jgi:ribonuclease HI
MVYELFFDGCSKGNPGHAGAGAVLYDNGIEIKSTSTYVGSCETNNVAEYSGLIRGLELTHGIDSLTIKGDSLLVIQQMKGVYAVKNPKLKVLYQKAKELCSDKSITFIHVPRNENTRADELSNIALCKQFTSVNE